MSLLTAALSACQPYVYPRSGFPGSAANLANPLEATALQAAQLNRLYLTVESEWIGPADPAFQGNADLGALARGDIDELCTPSGPSIASDKRSAVVSYTLSYDNVHSTTPTPIFGFNFDNAAGSSCGLTAAPVHFAPPLLYTTPPFRIDFTLQVQGQSSVPLKDIASVLGDVEAVAGSAIGTPFVGLPTQQALDKIGERAQRTLEQKLKVDSNFKEALDTTIGTGQANRLTYYIPFVLIDGGEAKKFYGGLKISVGSTATRFAVDRQAGLVVPDYTNRGLAAIPLLADDNKVPIQQIIADEISKAKLTTSGTSLDFVCTDTILKMTPFRLDDYDMGFVLWVVLSGNSKFNDGSKEYTLLPCLGPYSDLMRASHLPLKTAQQVTAYEDAFEAKKIASFNKAMFAMFTDLRIALSRPPGSLRENDLITKVLNDKLTVANIGSFGNIQLPGHRISLASFEAAQVFDVLTLPGEHAAGCYFSIAADRGDELNQNYYQALAIFYDKNLGPIRIFANFAKNEDAGGYRICDIAFDRALPTDEPLFQRWSQEPNGNGFDAHCGPVLRSA